jgi:hypothetical protein
VSSLASTREIFESCASWPGVEKLSLLCKNLRYHNVDARHVGFSQNPWLIVASQTGANRLNVDIAVMRYFETHPAEERAMLKLETTGEFEPGVMEPSKLQHILQSLSGEISPDIKHIADYYERYRDVIAHRFSKLSPSMDREKFKRVFNDVIYERFKKKDWYGAFTTMQMDLYALLRLFTRYDSAKMNRTRDKKSCGIENVNVIILAGLSHVLVYRAFFLGYFGATPDIALGHDIPKSFAAIPKNFQCVKMSKPFDFFA